MNFVDGDRFPSLCYKDKNYAHMQHEDSTLIDIPCGLLASSQNASHVWAWWDEEISLWRSIIAGKHEAQQFNTSSPLDRWAYAKYRFDFHHHYQKQSPPPIEMLKEEILCPRSDAAQQRFHRREMHEF